MYLIPYIPTNKSKLSLIYRFLCLRFVQFATHTYYQAILHSIVFWKNKSVLVQLFLFYLQQQVYRWAKRISFPLDENLLHGVLFTSCTQSISSAGLDCNPPTPHNSHTLHFWRGQNWGSPLYKLFGAGWGQKGVGGFFLKIRPHSCV